MLRERRFSVIPVSRQNNMSSPTTPSRNELFAALSAACDERVQLIAPVLAAFRAARVDHRRTIDKAEARFEAVGNPPPFDVLGSVALAVNRVTINGITHPLVPGIRARADTKGAMTRVSDIGGYGWGLMATLKTKKYDDREIVIVVEGADWAEMAIFSPEKTGWGSGKRNSSLQQEAVRLAKRIEVTAEAAPEWRPSVLQEAAELAREVKRVESETGTVDAALAELERAAVMPEVQSLVSQCEAFESSKISKKERLTLARGRALIATPFYIGPPPLPGRLRGAANAKDAFGAFQLEIGKMLTGQNAPLPPAPPLPLDEWIAEAEGPGAAADDATPRSAEPTSAPSDVEALERLAQLHAAGVLSDQEFAAAKQRVLGPVSYTHLTLPTIYSV